MIPTLLADLVAASVNESISNVLGNGRLAGNMSGSVLERLSRKCRSLFQIDMSWRHAVTHANIVDFVNICVFLPTFHTTQEAVGSNTLAIACSGSDHSLCIILSHNTCSLS